jgi:hypothetical protein
VARVSSCVVSRRTFHDAWWKNAGVGLGIETASN